MNASIARVFRVAIVGLFYLGLAGIFGAVEAAETTIDPDQCVLKPSTTIHLGAPVEGLIEKLSVAEGDVVRSGQIVAQLNSSLEAAEAAVAEARAANEQSVVIIARRLEFFRRQQDRASALRNRDVNAQVQYDSASTDAEVSAAALKDAEINRGVAKLDADRARAAVALRDVRSPIDGLVIEIGRNAGEYFHKKSSIVTIVRLDPLMVEAKVPPRSFSEVKLGDRIGVDLPAPSAGVQSATVISFDPIVDPKSGTMTLRLALPNPGTKIPAGLGCKLQMLLPN
jgi:RND family efflux transporter MFP subunit